MPRHFLIIGQFHAKIPHGRHDFGRQPMSDLLSRSSLFERVRLRRFLLASRAASALKYNSARTTTLIGFSDAHIACLSNLELTVYARHFYKLDIDIFCCYRYFTSNILIHTYGGIAPPISFFHCGTIFTHWLLYADRIMYRPRHKIWRAETILS